MAAPNPEIKPDARPSDSVRRMHNTPIGPTGAAIENPMSRPRQKKFRSIRRFHDKLPRADWKDLTPEFDLPELIHFAMIYAIEYLDVSGKSDEVRMNKPQLERVP